MTISIELPDDVLAAIKEAGATPSDFVAEAVRRFVEMRRRSGEDDIQRINAVADELNREAAEVLEFQAIP